MAPTLELASGTLSGTSEGSLAVFRGIRDARPPIGPLRFAAPEPPEPWTGVREATAFGPAAPGPGWPRSDPSARSTMVLGPTCEVADDPMAAERSAWAGLPTA